MRKSWPIILVVAIVLYLMKTKSDAKKSASSDGGVQVNSDDLNAYKNGTADASAMKRLGWPFIAEAELSFLSGPEGARVLGPMVNGPANRAPMSLHESALIAANELEPAYNTTIDGYTAKLAFMNTVLQKVGRPKIYGFEDQAQPHDI